MTGKDVPIIVKEKGIGIEYSGDNSRLKGEIKGLKFTDIDEAIKELYNWYVENKKSIRKEYLLLDK